VIQIEQAYLQGLAEYEAALQLATIAGRGELEAAYLQGAMEYEAALTQKALAEAVSASPSAQREEAYQLGVAYGEAQRLIEAIDKSAGEFSDELREAHDKGREDYAKAVGSVEEKAKKRGS
jgi:hypothetical protein